MAGRDTPDWMTTVQRQAFAVPGSPFSVTSGGTQTLDVALDTTIHTIVVLLANVIGTVTISVTGDVTGYQYLAPTNTTADAIFRVSIASQFDTTVTVKLVAASGASASAYVGLASDIESLNISNTVTTTGNVTVTNTVAITGSVTASFPSAQQVNIENVPTIDINPSGNGVVINSGTVDATISNATLDVTVQNSNLSVNVANTPTIEISAAGNGVTVNSGSINATIQNASLNSKVINDYLSVNKLVFLGANSFTTGGTPPTSVTILVDTKDGLTALFDTWYIIVFTGTTYLFLFFDTSTLVAQINGAVIATYGLVGSESGAIFSDATVNPSFPPLFNQVNLTLNSNAFAASTNYNVDVYGLRNIEPVGIVPIQALATEVDGTITTANTYQQIAQLNFPVKYILFQNQGTGTMNIAFSNASTPTGNGIAITPNGTYESDGVAIPYVNSADYLWVKGLNAGDAFVLFFA